MKLKHSKFKITSFSVSIVMLLNFLPSMNALAFTDKSAIVSGGIAHTGDRANMFVWLILLVAALGCIVIGLKKNKK